VRPHEVAHNGTVVEKKPSFDPNFNEPQLPQLEAVKASGKLLKNGSFTFTGVNRGAIDPNVRATYMFGIDRSGNLPAGPIPGRPNIRFDAVVYARLVPGKAPSLTVYDAAAKKYTFMPNSGVVVSGIVIDFWHRGLGALEAMASGPRTRTFQERVYAMVAGCYSSIFRRIAE
jgi:hypothetical protein